MSDLLLRMAENQRIETERLLLRPVGLADAEDMYAFASDEAAVRFVFKRHESLQDTREQIASYFLNAPLGKFGVERKEDQKMIGTLDFHRIQPELRVAEIGYSYHPAVWGQGYATEALEAATKWGFETIQLNALELIHDTQNPASGRVMEKAGYQQLYVRSYSRMDQKEADRIITDVVYRLTKEEYQTT